MSLLISQLISGTVNLLEPARAIYAFEITVSAEVTIYISLG